MIKADKTYRYLYGMLYILAGGFLINILADWRGLSFVAVALTFPNLLFYTSSTLGIIILLQTLKKKEEVRQAAATQVWDKKQYSDETEPADNAMKLEFPYELRMRGHLGLVLLPLEMASLFIIPGIWWFLFDRDPIYREGMIILLTAMTVFGVGGSTLLVAFLYKKISIDDIGITCVYMGRTRTIPWHTARLFAIDGNHGYYEVSSATTIIRWNPIFFHRVMVSWEELAVMELLIRRSSGLPLFNLRRVSQ